MLIDDAKLSLIPGVEINVGMCCAAAIRILVDAG
jgi:hypothetical protein